MADLKANEPTWQDFRAYILDTMVHDRDAKAWRDPSFVSAGRARSYMMRHPVWGLWARPELQAIAAEVAHEVGELSESAVPLARIDKNICACGLGTIAKNSYLSIRRFVDLWGPDGPLAIADEAWKREPDFIAWFAKHGSVVASEKP